MKISLFILKRFAAMVPVLLGATFVSFLLLHLSPVDPAKAYLSASGIIPTEDTLNAVRTQLGLDRPFWSQYGHWLWQIGSLDFGTSFFSKIPVSHELAARLPITITLALSSLAIAILVSIPLGIASALHKNLLLDHICRLLAFLGASLPQFWLAYLLIYFLSVKLDWFPLQGADSWQHYVLPSFTLAFALIATYSRLLRNGLLEAREEPFVMYAKARGLGSFVLVGRHMLRHAIRPVVTAAGMNLGKLFAGTVIVEQIFAMPGMGSFFLDSVFHRDYPVIQSFVFMMAVMFVVGNLAADMIQAYLDPRLTQAARKGE
ncbi:nickel ABC transporter permease [Paenibacillus nasutitermitis]|uniref:Nickel import system permease protein NikB n=1 Tax=Paenibacillus nasutitermitis TaxID=1652958 RepID=A0A916YIM1_9BACL|nr:nickel ABC transporter permease [Paenibacillus nasutitermitis]GGD46806.1 nickel ABC transporter permease subunit NikB [Paenibacillus nasutitermitis]